MDRAAGPAAARTADAIATPRRRVAARLAVRTFGMAPPSVSRRMNRHGARIIRHAGRPGMVASGFMDRRDFIKIVVSGSLASLGCPDAAFRSSAPAGGARAGAAGGPPGETVRAEINAWCHAVRDGAEFRTPRPS